MDTHGLYSDPDGDPTTAVRVTGALDVVAETRRPDGQDWGLLLRWWDRDGAAHEAIVRREELTAGGAAVCRRLADRGFWIAPEGNARRAFLTFLSAVEVPYRVTVVAAPGWAGEAYVLPDETVGPANDERAILDINGGQAPDMTTAGDLAGWCEQVAAPAVGNTRLAFALSAALAPPLLAPLGLEGGGVHFRGASSTGKTTLLAAAASVWGPPSFMASWRATANGLEGIAASRNDGLLVLDEMGQVSGRDACEAAYMLANGEGKARAGRRGEGESRRSWRTLFLSSGEIGLAEKAREAKLRLAAGQAVRVLDVPADAGAGRGAFEALHGHPDAGALARHLKAAAGEHHGHAARAFVRVVVRDRQRVAAAAQQQVEAFLTDQVPAGADGQVQRAAQRYGVIAAAGEIATAEGIVPWPDGEATRAAAVAFRAWLDARGGAGSQEERDILDRVRAFLDAHGGSRFQPLKKGAKAVANRAGYVHEKSGCREYCFTPDAFRREICNGLDHGTVVETLKAHGVLVPGKAGRSTQRIRTADGPKRVYVVRHPQETGADDP